MDLVRDMLDEQAIDREGRKMGKVDGIILALEPGRAPRVVAVQIGGAVAARRVHPVLARWFVRLTQWLGVSSGEPLRVAVGQMTRRDEDWQMDVDLEQTPAYAWERWLRDRVVGRIPGSGL